MTNRTPEYVLGPWIDVVRETLERHEGMVLSPDVPHRIACANFQRSDGKRHHRFVPTPGVVVWRWAPGRFRAERVWATPGVFRGFESIDEIMFFSRVEDAKDWCEQWQPSLYEEVPA